MICEFGAGPINLALRMEGFEPAILSPAEVFLRSFPPRADRATLGGVLRPAGEPGSMRGGLTLALGPVRDGLLEVPQPEGLPKRFGAPRVLLHGIMGLLAHHLRSRDSRIFHSAARVLDGIGGVLVLGPSEAGKSTLTARLGGVELGDEVLAVAPTAPGSWCLRPCLLPGERMPATWDDQPLGAIVLVEQGQPAMAQRLKPSEARTAVADAVIRLRGDQFFDDLDWVARLLADVPVYRLRWGLDNDPLTLLKRAHASG